jgi:hypothetical protein
MGGVAAAVAVGNHTSWAPLRVIGINEGEATVPRCRVTVFPWVKFRYAIADGRW